MPTPYGLFQIGADCNFRVLTKVKPRNLSHLASVIALARPGALAYVDQFARFLESDQFESIHEYFDEILKETGSIPIFQEQLMKMIHHIGFSLDDAETIRRVVGKKKVEEAKVWKEKIADKIKEKGLDSKIADVLWKVVQDSSHYSFNLSHAAAYATLSASSTYVKFKYPQEFYIECLNAAEQKADNRAEISLINQELIHFGIKILPPDLSKSKMDFTKEGENIRYGLKSIKGISSKSLGALENFVARERIGKFQIFQAAKESGLNIGILSALIQAGTMDSLLRFGETRSSLVYEAQLFNLLKDGEKLYMITNGAEYDNSLFEAVKSLPNWVNESGKKVARSSRIETLKKGAAQYREIFTQNNSFPEFANYVYEKELLGYSYSTTLRDVCRNSHSSDLISAKQFAESSEYYYHVCGEIKEIKYQKSKAGKQYLKIDISDETGVITCMKFEPDVFDFVKLDVYGKLQEGSRVIISGKKWNDSLIFDKVRLLDEKIFMKLADLKG